MIESIEFPDESISATETLHYLKTMSLMSVSVTPIPCNSTLSTCGKAEGPPPLPVIEKLMCIWKMRRESSTEYRTSKRACWRSKRDKPWAARSAASRRNSSARPWWSDWRGTSTAHWLVSCRPGTTRSETNSQGGCEREELMNNLSSFTLEDTRAISFW